MENLRTPLRCAAVLTVALCVPAAPAAADAIADHFKGRQISIAVGYSPGGGYDTYTRLLIRHFSKHIPGNPNIVVQNMPGAGSMKAANWTYNVAPKDGTALGVFSAPTAMEPLLGNKNAKFDALKFAWLGNMFRDSHGCATWHTSKIASFDQVMASKTPVVFGATSLGTYGYQQARLLSEMLGANIKIVTGYKGIKEVALAMQQGELQVACAMAVSTVKTVFGDAMDKGELKMLVQFGVKDNAFMKGAPSFYRMLKTDDQRRTAELFFGLSSISRPLAAPPGLKPELVAALRKAMTDTVNDPALLADAGRLKLDIDAETGEEVQAAFKGFMETPPAVVASAKKIMGRK